MKKFINTAKPLTDPEELKWRRNPYKFDRVPTLLFLWSRLFQSTVSQAATFLFTGTFHSSRCAIYKCEGGCNIPGVNELVLGKNGCYMDYGRDAKSEQQAKQCADLITYVVLNWDPENPIDSILNAATGYLIEHKKPTTVEALKKAIELTGAVGPFSGNALSDFFHWNPFSEQPEMKDYERFCLVKFSNKTEAEVDQTFADRDLGKELLEAMQHKIRSNKANRGDWPIPLCCSPRRNESKLSFWINTGRSTQIDGWKTEEEIRSFLASDGKIIDKL